MRTVRILTITASVILFSGTLIALPGCGEAEEQRLQIDEAAVSKSREAREAFAKTEKKQTTRRAGGRGTDPRG
jgi:hypothetical protein